MNIQSDIKKLACYALEKGLISIEEFSYSVNLLLDVLSLDEFSDDGIPYQNVDLESTLKEILDYAFEKKLIKENSVIYRDLFDTKVMNCFTPRPKEVIDTFLSLEKEDPKKATNYFYHLSLDSDYIRSYRIKKDIRWVTSTKYGDMDITINLSKPEKDPKAIALAKLQKASSYPKCLLCKENIGYKGNLNHPARETIRYIPLHLKGGKYYLQYSPYSYYKEHCIVFNSEHVPMVIHKETFENLFDFVSSFPHYMLGSNADLPIVGGSILTHDHYQGGHYRFKMFDAKDVFAFTFQGYEDIKASYLYWPLSVIRLKGKDKERMIALANKILTLFRDYSDSSLNIIAYSEDNTPHNTITPILHKEKDTYILDLALRNNLTNEEHPLGIYHPHEEYWNIKKENIGLIEVMGMAVLPSRLKQEMEILMEDKENHMDISKDERIHKHANWFSLFEKEYDSLKTKEEKEELLKQQIGLTFMQVLECCGIFKQNKEGLAGIHRFIDYIDQH